MSFGGYSGGLGSVFGIVYGVSFYGASYGSGMPLGRTAGILSGITVRLGGAILGPLISTGNPNFELGIVETAKRF